MTHAPTVFAVRFAIQDEAGEDLAYDTTTLSTAPEEPNGLCLGCQRFPIRRTGIASRWIVTYYDLPLASGPVEIYRAPSTLDRLKSLRRKGPTPLFLPTLALVQPDDVEIRAFRVKIPEQSFVLCMQDPALT